MSTQVQLRKGTSAQHATFTGALAEVTVDTTNNSLRVHDGVTAGGSIMATKSQVDAIAVAASLGFPPYDTIALGIAATSDGGVFSVPSETALTLYQNDGGAADVIASLPLSGVVDDLEARTEALETLATTGTAPRAAVDLATTANVTLSGEQTIDGTLTSSSAVLVQAQTLPAQNGVYITAAGAWTRRADMDAAGEFAGASVYVNGGTINGGATFFTASEVATVGTDPVVWVESRDESGLKLELDATAADLVTLERSLVGVSQSIGVSGELPTTTDGTRGTYTFNEPFAESGKGIRFYYQSNVAGTLNFQIQTKSGDIITVVSEHSAPVTGAGAGFVEFPDLEYTAGQYPGLRASLNGVIAAASGTDPLGWYYTISGITAGNTYTDTDLSTNAVIMCRFELLEQVVTGPRFSVLENTYQGIVGDGASGSFHLHLVLGESHAAGVPTTLSPEVIPAGRGYCYRRATTNLGPLQDPTGNTATAIAGTGRGSPWVAFGSQMLRQSSNLQGAIIVNSGAGGTTAVGQWASGGTSWLQAVTDFGNAITAIEADEHIISGRSISIILGSNDAAVGTTKVNFKAAMIALIARARTLVGAGDDVPVTLMKTGPYVDGSYAAAVAYIQEAQEEIAAEETNVYIGYSAEYAVSKGQMIDNVHMTQGFYDLAGASIAIPSFTHGSGK